MKYIKYILWLLIPMIAGTLLGLGYSFLLDIISEPAWMRGL